MGEKVPATKSTDGVVSRYLNRKLSLPLSRLIVARRWPISPDAMSLTGFFIGIIAALLFAVGQPLGGGLVAQISAILDGCDGEIARLTGRQSRRGAVLDSILDRLADGGLIMGMTVFISGRAIANGRSPIWSLVWGFLALIGAYGISYSSAIARAMGYRDFPRAIAGRDARLFLIMLAGIVAAIVPSALVYFLIFLACSSFAELAWRLRRL